MPRLTEKQRKKIIADYTLLGTYSAVAKKYKISPNTVKKYVREDPEFAEKCEQKKRENSASVLDHMKRKVPKVCDFIDHVLEAMDDPEKLADTGIQQLATALGIIIDKFTGTPVEIERLRADVEKLQAQTANLRGEDPRSGEREDDPITKSLKEQFKG